jgi:crotonobetainyl-CoA:carnitine CoA-transferase CaiB-like acyl-CoA transferase
VAELPSAPQELDGVRVLDLSQYVAGPFCARLLEMYGADVIKVERPLRGDLARQAGPFLDPARPDQEQSGLFLYLNSGKRSVALDLSDAAGRDALLRLAAGAQILIESFRPGTLESWGLSPDELLRVNPRLVIVRISNFGQTGPYRDWKASELVLYAIGGELFSTGVNGREPAKLYGTVTQIEAGASLAAATMAALLHAEATGQGQVIDCALTETQLAGIDRRSAALTAYQYSGKITERTAGAGGFPSVWPCADGYVEITASIAPRPWGRMLEMLGRPENLLDPKFARPGALTDPATRDELLGAILEWTVARGKRDAWLQAQAARVLSGPLNTLADVYADPVLNERGLFVEVKHPRTGTIRQPHRPFVLSRTPARPPRAAPLLSEHTHAVLAEAAKPAVEQAAKGDRERNAPADSAVYAGDPPWDAAAARLPLAGVRVVDLTVVWAGPFATHILADLGAEVIRVENVNAFQTLTRGVSARPAQVTLDFLPPWMGGYPGGVPGERPWNRYPTFNCHARNKRSVTIDLLTEEGQRDFATLIATADVVADNNVAETMVKLGVTWERLRAIRPDIIYLRQPGFADSGPYAAFRALGIHLEGFIGHSLLRRYPDLDASMLSSVFVADYMAGAMGAFAVQLALRHRRRTGEGQLIELSQAENALPIVAQAAMAYALSGAVEETIGNRHPTAVQGVYPCLPEDEAHGGADRWIALTIATDAEWLALAEVIDDPEWSAWAWNDALATPALRRQHHDAIDARLAQWTATQHARDLMNDLQEAGVAAGMVMHAGDCYADPQLQARDFFVETSQSDCGSYPLPGFMWRFGGTPLRVRRGPVKLGEDNESIYLDLLGRNSDYYEDLRQRGLVGEAFAAGMP